MSETTLPQQIRTLLLESGKTVSVAESITAGHLQSMISSATGASDVFKGGVTAYKLSVKVDVLGVDKALAEETDCVSAEITRQMAAAALELFKSDYAISSCGYAEPYPERGITEPFAYISIVSKQKGLLVAEKVNLSGTRVTAQKQAARIALEKFVELLQI